MPKWLLNIGIVCAIVVVGSCKKLDEPDLQSNDVQFFITGQLQSTLLTMEAGNDSAYMHTTYSQDDLNVYEFKGTLGHQDCMGQASCEESISLIFRDGKVSNGTNTSIDSTLSVGAKAFRGPIDSTINSYTVQFTDASYAKNGVLSYAWDFGDGTTSTEADPQHTYSVSTPSPVRACLTVTDNHTGTTSTICNDIYLPTNCKADFTYIFDSTSLEALNAIEQGTGPYDYYWDFGNGYLPLGSQTLPDFSSLDSIEVCVKIVDALGCEATMCKYMIVSSLNINCAAQFNWSTKENWTLNVFDLNEVIIQFTDANGKVWSSDRYQQDNAVFTIIDIHNFDANMEGQPTKSVQFEGRCKLFGTSVTDVISFNEINGKMAIAYPN
jgi:hypothetical protein